MIDDISGAAPVTDAELDAVEAFLMPVANAILGGRPLQVKGAGQEREKGFKSSLDLQNHHMG